MDEVLVAALGFAGGVGNLGYRLTVAGDHLDHDVHRLDARDVAGQVGCAVSERHILHQRGTGIKHGRSDRGIVRLHRSLEGFEGLMGGAGRNEDLGRGTPHHHAAINTVLGLEVADEFTTCAGPSSGSA